MVVNIKKKVSKKNIKKKTVKKKAAQKIVSKKKPKKKKPIAKKKAVKKSTVKKAAKKPTVKKTVKKTIGKPLNKKASAKKPVKKKISRTKKIKLKFKKNDKIIYPSHGAGIIIDIVNKKIQDTKQIYYIINTAHGNLKITVPAQVLHDLKPRNIFKKFTLQKYLKKLKKKPRMRDTKWRQYQEICSKEVRAGEIDAIIFALAYLYPKYEERNMSATEKKIFDLAKIFLNGEIMFSYNIDFSDADKLLNKYLKKK